MSEPKRRACWCPRPAPRSSSQIWVWEGAPIGAPEGAVTAPGSHGIYIATPLAPFQESRACSTSQPNSSWCPKRGDDGAPRNRCFRAKSSAWRGRQGGAIRAVHGALAWRSPNVSCGNLVVSLSRLRCCAGPAPERSDACSRERRGCGVVLLVRGRVDVRRGVCMSRLRNAAAWRAQRCG
jgi:hypothetical protein